MYICPMCEEIIELGFVLSDNDIFFCSSCYTKLQVVSEQENELKIISTDFERDDYDDKKLNNDLKDYDDYKEYYEYKDDRTRTKKSQRMENYNDIDY